MVEPISQHTVGMSKRTLAYGIRFLLGALLPSLAMFACLLVFSGASHRTAGPEGGFAQLGFATVSLGIIGIVTVLNFAISLFPFQNVPALLVFTFPSAVAGTIVISTLV